MPVFMPRPEHRVEARQFLASMSGAEKDELAAWCGGELTGISLLVDELPGVLVPTDGFHERNFSFGYEDDEGDMDFAGHTDWIIKRWHSDEPGHFEFDVETNDKFQYLWALDAELTEVPRPAEED